MPKRESAAGCRAARAKCYNSQAADMPIYEYECPKCGQVFEEWGKASEAHKEEPCPKCGALSPRVISRTSFVLKGDGWYVSDYGYRKGITEDSGSGADVPVPAKSTSPAKQGEKAVAVQPKKDIAKTGSPKKDTAAAKAGSKPADRPPAKERNND